MASKNDGAGVSRRARALSFSTVTGDCRKLSSTLEADTTTSDKSTFLRVVSAGTGDWARAANWEKAAIASSPVRKETSMYGVI